MHAADARRFAASTPGAILLESTSTPSALGRSLLFHDPITWLEAHTVADVPALLEQLEQARAEGLYAAGYLSYEAGYAFEPTAVGTFPLAPGRLPLAAFGLYHAPQFVTSSSEASAAARGVLSLDYSLTEDTYTARFGRAHAAIARGESYQLNLTLDAHAVHTDPLALYEHLCVAQPVPFAALFRVGEHAVLSASPELFFHLRDREILTRPMKGTARRSTDPSADAAARDRLASSPKDRAENVMIVDLLRNDLGRIALPGSVRTENLFHIESLPSVFQMTSDVRATLRPGVGLPELFRALFPSGSIVGAPKVHTMRLLRDLEQRARGIYTGAIGFLAPDEAVFSVAIRTAMLTGAELTLGIGSGVVADSSAESEYRECALKASFLLDRSFRLIESLRWDHGRCPLLDLHLTRLRASAEQLGFSLDEDRLHTELAAHAATLDPTLTYKLRFELALDGTLAFFAPEIIGIDDSPLRVAVHPTRAQSADPWLRHKTTARHLYNSATAEARQHGLADVLFLNERGHLTEGAIHNIFVRHGARWRTPPLSDGVLPGVFRTHLLSTGTGIEETSLTPDDLHSADEIVLTNAVRGARPAVLVPWPANS